MVGGSFAHFKENLPESSAPKRDWAIRIALVAIALGLGYSLALSEKTRVREMARHLQNQDIARQLEAQSERAAERLDSLRSQALLFSTLRKTSPDAQVNSPILAWAEAEVPLGRNQAYNIKQLSLSQEMLSRRPPLATLGRDWLRLSLGKIPLSEIQENGSAILLLREEMTGRHEFAAVLFRSPDLVSASVQTVLIAVVDPVELFSGIDSISTGRSYILFEGATVLAHSQKGYVATDFSSIPQFVSWMKTGKAQGSSTFKSIDRQRVRATFSRLGGNFSSLPLLWVAEQPLSANEAALPTEKPSIWNRILEALHWIAVVGILFALLAVFRVRPMDSPAPMTSLGNELGFQIQMPEIEMAEIQMAEVKNSAPFTTPLPPAPAATASSHVDQMVEQFDARTQSHSTDPRQVVTQLTLDASQLWKKPALFFSYHHENRAGVLRFFAGFPAGRKFDRMAFDVSPEIVERIKMSYQQDVIVSLAEYSPLVQLLVVKCGMSRMEAWPVCVREHDQLRILGIMAVITESYEIEHQQNPNANATSLSRTL